jgi:chemotaxis signal transduction protein
VSTLPYLLVRLGDSLAALPASSVRRVVRGARLHPLPGAGPGLIGLAEFAGEPLAVLDLAQLLGEEPRGLRPPVTVVTWLGSGAERELVGLGVDDAIEVTELDPAAVAAGQALVGGRPAVVVDTERLGVVA